MKVRVKESIAILEESEDVYAVIQTASRRVQRFGTDKLVRQIIRATLRERDYQELTAELEQQFPRDDIIDCVSALEHEGILRTYSQKDDGKYARQVAFIDEHTHSYTESLALQRRIEDATVAVFGVGGIGSWIVNGLAQIGVGTLRIVDPDTVSLSNLNRQLHYRQQDVGKYKVDVLQERIDANIKTDRRRLDEHTCIEDVLEGCDLVVNCADTPSVADTTRIIDRTARPKRIAYIAAGGYNLHLGMVGPIVIPGRTACFDCFLAHQQESDPLRHLRKIKDVEQSGNLGPIAGAIANIQVTEAFKYLTGLGTVNTDRFAEIDFMDFAVEWRHYQSRPDCRTCGYER